MYINVEKLKEILCAKRGAQVITIEAYTKPDFNKSLHQEAVDILLKAGLDVQVVKGKALNPFYGRVRKLARVNGIINWNYTRSVNAQRERENLEPDFIAEPRKWGERLPNLPLVRHVKDGVEKLYLEIKIQRSLHYRYILDNHKAIGIENDLITACLPIRAESSRQQVEKEVILRDYELSNIKRIRINGTTYQIVPLENSSIP